MTEQSIKKLENLHAIINNYAMMAYLQLIRKRWYL